MTPSHTKTTSKQQHHKICLEMFLLYHRPNMMAMPRPHSIPRVANNTKTDRTTRTLILKGKSTNYPLAAYLLRERVVYGSSLMGAFNSAMQYSRVCRYSGVVSSWTRSQEHEFHPTPHRNGMETQHFEKYRIALYPGGFGSSNDRLRGFTKGTSLLVNLRGIQKQEYWEYQSDWRATTISLPYRSRVDKEFD